MDYARNGLIGVLTPQANATVEPEFNILLPPGVVALSARLYSAAASMDARLIEYGDSIPTQLRQFGEAPLDVVALAVTGSSYFLGPKAEDVLVSRTFEETGVPLVTAARAIVDALTTLSATRLTLVSPYPNSLNERAHDYWTARGFTVGKTLKIEAAPGPGHPIYSVDSGAAARAVEHLSWDNTDAVLILGTGIASLSAMAERAGSNGAPLLSSMLCLAWRSVGIATGVEPSKPELSNWLSGTHWIGKLTQHQTM